MRVARILLVILLVVGGVSGTAPGAANEFDSSTAAAQPVTDPVAPSETVQRAESGGVDPRVSRTVSYDRTPTRPGEVSVTVTFRVGAEVEELHQYLPENVTIAQRDGFDRGRDPDGDPRLEWDHATDRPSVVLLFENRTNSIDRNRRIPEVLDTGPWAYLDEPYLETQYYDSDGLEWYSSETNASRFELHERVNGTGVVTGSIVYLGAYEKYTRNVSGERLELVVPDAANSTVAPERGLQTVANASTRLELGGRGGTVSMFVMPTTGVPDEQWNVTGLRNGPDSFWVFDDTWSFTWRHEYVHTRQEFDPADELRWIREGSANYYAYLETVREGDYPYRSLPWWDAEQRQDRLQNDTVLADPKTWHDFTDYNVGPIVLATLEARIRNGSTDATLTAVFRRMNDHQGAVTAADFRRFVAEAAGTSQQAWLERHVSGSAVPAPPREPFRYTAGPESDSEDDGLTVERERSLGTHPFENDTDGDGLLDGNEVEIHGTDPTAYDTDGDGRRDGAEVQEDGTDPTVPDLENDRDDTPRRSATDAESTAGGADERSGDESSTSPVIAGSAILGILSFWLAIVTMSIGGVVVVARFVDNRLVDAPTFIVGRSLRRIGLLAGLCVVLAIGSFLTIAWHG